MPDCLPASVQLHSCCRKCPMSVDCVDCSPPLRFGSAPTCNSDEAPGAPSTEDSCAGPGWPSRAEALQEGGHTWEKLGTTGKGGTAYRCRQTPCPATCHITRCADGWWRRCDTGLHTCTSESVHEHSASGGVSRRGTQGGKRCGSLYIVGFKTAMSASLSVERPLIGGKQGGGLIVCSCC